MYPYWIEKGYKLYKNTSANLRGLFDKTYFKIWDPWFLNRSQWFSEEELMDLQLEGLKQLVDHANKNTVYYKDLPNIRSLEDLKKIPILTKKIIRGNFDNLRAKNIPGFKVETSGTVSKSTTIKDKRLKFDFSGQRFLSWYGKPLKKICRLWGSIDVGSKPYQKGRYLKLPVETLNTHEDAIEYLHLIEQFKPDFIEAYANPLRFLANYALEEGIQPEVGVIQTACEPLFPKARKEIEKAFQCEVFNFYGSRELGSMAQDCEVHGDLHINAERYIVEEVEGRLLFTDLLNYAMPLIRYENQDMGKLSNQRCACGRGLPTMKSIIGRTMGYLFTKKDTWLLGRNLHLPIVEDEIFDWVESFQFKQVSKGEVTVLLKPWSESEYIPDLDELKKIFYQRVSKDDLDISIEIVDSLILSDSGKQIRCITYFTPFES